MKNITLFAQRPFRPKFGKGPKGTKTRDQPHTVRTMPYVHTYFVTPGKASLPSTGALQSSPRNFEKEPTRLHGEKEGNKKNLYLVGMRFFLICRGRWPGDELEYARVAVPIQCDVRYTSDGTSTPVYFHSLCRLSISIFSMHCPPLRSPTLSPSLIFSAPSLHPREKVPIYFPLPSDQTGSS